MAEPGPNLKGPKGSFLISCSLPPCSGTLAAGKHPDPAVLRFGFVRGSSEESVRIQLHGLYLQRFRFTHSRVRPGSVQVSPAPTAEVATPSGEPRVLRPLALSAMAPLLWDAQTVFSTSSTETETVSENVG